jgi:hypothetical protein
LEQLNKSETIAIDQIGRYINQQLMKQLQRPLIDFNEQVSGDNVDCGVPTESGVCP